MPTDAIETENQEEPQVAEKPLDKMTGTKPTLNTKELKKKILVLRKEKDAAREIGDKHRLDILRRRINRLKKRTRKAAQA